MNATYHEVVAARRASFKIHARIVTYLLRGWDAMTRDNLSASAGRRQIQQLPYSNFHSPLTYLSSRQNENLWIVSCGPKWAQLRPATTAIRSLICLPTIRRAWRGAYYLLFLTIAADAITPGTRTANSVTSGRRRVVDIVIAVALM